MSNKFDRIFRENNEALFRSFVRRHFGIEVVEATDLPGKMSRTVEREPDFVKVVTTLQGERFIIHLEYQSSNDPDMIGRMRTYHALLAEKYKMRVRQLVVYIGQEPSRMRNRLEEDEVMRGFELVDIARSDIGDFLNSEVVEEVILAILADFGGRNPEAVVRLILRRIAEAGKNKTQIDRALQQLIIYSRIPKLESLVKKEIKYMPLAIDITQYELYQEGKAEGIEEGLEKGKAEGIEEGLEKGKAEVTEAMVTRMLSFGNLSVEEVARLTGLDIEQVTSIRDKNFRAG